MLYLFASLFIALTFPLLKCETFASAPVIKPEATPSTPSEGSSPICGWFVIDDSSHPSRPRQIIRGTSSEACVKKQIGKPIVRLSDTLSMIYRTQNATGMIRVTALEDGAIGGRIRCRSSIDGSIITAIIIDAQTVEPVSSERTTAW